MKAEPLELIIVDTTKLLQLVNSESLRKPPLRSCFNLTPHSEFNIRFKFY